MSMTSQIYNDTTSILYKSAELWIWAGVSWEVHMNTQSLGHILMINSVLNPLPGSTSQFCNETNWLGYPKAGFRHL